MRPTGRLKDRFALRRGSLLAALLLCCGAPVFGAASFRACLSPIYGAIFDVAALRAVQKRLFILPNPDRVVLTCSPRAASTRTPARGVARRAQRCRPGRHPGVVLELERPTLERPA
jgi:hypothetical protein